MDLSIDNKWEDIGPGVRRFKIPQGYIYSVSSGSTGFVFVPAKHNKCTIKYYTLDFEELYKMYPRKIGKKSGITKLQSKIKTQEDFEKVKIAIINYTNQIKKLCTEEKYIKHFSSFVNNYEDYLTEEVKKSEPKSLKEYGSSVLSKKV